MRTIVTIIAVFMVVKVGFAQAPATGALSLEPITIDHGRSGVAHIRV
jgi:hypothetical protein